MTQIRCPACASWVGSDVADLGTLPALSGVVYDDRAGARNVPAGRVLLRSCTRCNHIYNTLFDPSLVPYDERYDNSLDHSAVFADYADELAARLVNNYRLSGGTAVEVGCGSGSFLRRLHQHGMARGVGFDPAAEAHHDALAAVTVVPGSLPPQLDVSVDLMCCRHVLEHLADPLELLNSLSAAAGRPTKCYIEVPHGPWTTRSSGPWDVIYPHVSYFTAHSLHTLLVRAGARILRLAPSYFGQFLAADVEIPAAASVYPPARPATLWLATAEFRRQLDGVQRWAGWLRTRRARTVVWGAGSKGTTFLNLVDSDARLIDFAVDLNPSKWGRYLPGTGHQVLRPDRDFLKNIDQVLVMNPVYRQEVRTMLTELGLNPRLTAV